VAQIPVADAHTIQKRSTVLNWNLKRLSENDYFAARIALHGIANGLYAYNSEISSQKGQALR
jgi:hypothetical protein